MTRAHGDAGLPAPLSAGAQRLVRLALYVEPDEARQGALRDHARTLDEATLRDLVPHLELHGVLPLVCRNLRDAQVALPTTVDDELRAAETRLLTEGSRDPLTVERFLAAAGRAGVTVTLLKGASLAQDVFRSPGLRAQGDVDLLVDEAELPRAIAAAEESGWYVAEERLPLWWYRLAHFHFKLTPGVPLLKEIELHWRLHHPALLLTIQHADLVRRRVPVPALGEHVHTLDPLDRYLHLVTHLVSHASELPSVPPSERITTWLSQPPYPVRLKWLLDVCVETERLATESPPEDVQVRAREWNADPSLAWLLAAVREAELLSDHAAAWSRAFEEDAQTSTNESPKRVAAAAPLPHLDFRADALALFPRWLWPPRAYLTRRYPGKPAIASRPIHALRVLAKTAAGALTLPIAWLVRTTLRQKRTRAKDIAVAPESVLDVAAAWRRAQSKEP